MAMPTFWKFLPAAALVLAALLFAGGSPRTAFAEVTETTSAAASIISGGQTMITVELTSSQDRTRISATASDSGTLATLTLVDCTPNCDAEVGESAELGEEISVGIANRHQLFLTLEATCTKDDTITVTAEQDGESNSAVVACIGPSVTIVKSALGAESLRFAFTGTGTDTECDVTFSLRHQGSSGLLCDRPGTYTITESPGTGWSLAAIHCDTAGGASTTINLAERWLNVTLMAATTSGVICTFTNVPSTPTVAVAVAAASTLTVSASPAEVGCNGNSSVLVSVRDMVGNAVATGTAINLSVTGGGSITPAGTATLGADGGLAILYTAPSTGSGAATITAIAGSAVGGTTVNFACAAASATAVPPPPPPPASGSTISPPNTGDAGLG